MSESHKKYLPIIRDHWEAANVTTFIEPSFGPQGERPDTLGLVERGITGLWGDVELYPGTLITSDLKMTVSDLQHDEKKAWRHTLGIGDYRFYWLLKDGPVRPEHVLEDSWWGVIEFNESYWQVVRKPRGFKETRKLTERLLLWRLALDAGRERNAGHGLPARSPSKAVRQSPPSADGKLVDAHLGGAQCTSREIKKFLRERVGKKYTTAETQALLRSIGYTAPDVPGGWWSKTHDAAEAS